jgi:hypothetical protein
LKRGFGKFTLLSRSTAQLTENQTLQAFLDCVRFARNPGSTANLSDRASDQFRYADFAGESLIGIAGWANHNGSQRERMAWFNSSDSPRQLGEEGDP